MLFGIIGCCEVDKHNTGLLFFQKAVLDFLGHQSDLIYHQFSASKTRLLTREQWGDDRFDTGKDKSFEYLVGNAKQRNETKTFDTF